MLIVSKFHDYYDTALAHGIDKTCVYNRATEKIEATHDDKASLLQYKAWLKKGADPWRGRPVEFLTQAIVGFAGNLYPMFYHKFIDPYMGDPTFMYDAKSCAEFLDKSFPETRQYDNDRKYSLRWQLDMSDGAIEDFFRTEKHQRFQRLFMEHKIPSFVVRKTRMSIKIESNPVLKEYAFMKVKDPYTAMQEIHMYLSGVIGMAERDTAEVCFSKSVSSALWTRLRFRR